MIRRRLTTAAFSLFCALVCGCSERAGIDRVEWTTMGTVAALQTRGGVLGAEDREKCRKICNDVTAQFDVHNPSSVISRVKSLPDAGIAARGGCWEAAMRFRDETGHAFNPRWKGPQTLDFGGIAKGYAVDMMHDALLHCDVDTLIDLGGNLRSVKGDWRVSVAASSISFVLHASEACATSAEYFRGRHISDGRTGKPVDSTVKSVTVVAPTALAADALSTAFFVLGPESPLVEELCRKHSARVYWVKKEGH